MYTREIAIAQGPAEVESLACALRAVLASRGVEAAYDDLNFALGLPFFTCANRTLTHPALHATVARDAGLLHAAALFGLHLRPLHPRELTATLTATSEFALHFRDSYAPLIHRALDHEQPVLAWQGWPAPAQRGWGIITAAHPETGVLRGVIAGVDGIVALPAPALQCFVVEEIAPRTPTPAEMLATADHALGRLGQECSRSGPRICGVQACQYWIEEFKTPLTAAHVAAYAALFARLCADRVCGLRWLDKHAADVECDPAATGALRVALTSGIGMLSELLAALSGGAIDRVPAVLTSLANLEAPMTTTVHTMAVSVLPTVGR